MTNQIEQGSRLKTLLSIIGIKQLPLAQRLGFTRGYISLIVNGEKPMSQKFLNSLAECYPKVNINWLLTGNGSALTADEPVKSYQIENEVGRPRTLEDMEAEYRDDPFRGLREMLLRIEVLERKLAELEDIVTKKL